MRRLRKALLSRENNDAGTIIPLVLLCFLVALFMTCGAIAASAAFLAQRDLSSVCDGAALAAAQNLDDKKYYDISGDAARQKRDHMDAGAQRLADEYVATAARSTVRATARVHGDSVTVHCSSIAHLPFGALFGYGKGLPRHVMASAEMT